MNNTNPNCFRQAITARPMKIWGVMLIVLPMLCGCIYDSPKDDSFYRTLWRAEGFPYGAITLEFLCENNVKIKGNDAIGSYGFYEPVEHTAYFSSLDLKYEADKNVTIIIDEALRTGETMQITWHRSDSNDSFTTTMTRLKSYQ